MSGSSDTVHLANMSSARSAPLLLAIFNSFVFDFLARSSMGGSSLNYFILKQLPVPPPSTLEEQARGIGSSYSDFIIPRVLELSYTSWELKDFAEDIGFTGPPFKWDDERRFLIQCEIDALMFHLYGVNCEDIEYIMETFKIVKKDDEELPGGTYRTKEEILRVFCEMIEADSKGEIYVSKLDPIPGQQVEEESSQSHEGDSTAKEK